jgi:putative two-component system response regulator
MSRRVLVAIHDSSVTDALVKALHALDREPVVVRSGTEATECLGNDPAIRTVITEPGLPELDGISLCHWIRTKRQDGYTFTLLVLPKSGPKPFAASLGAGVDEFLSRPIDPEEVAARLNTGDRLISVEARDQLLFAMAKLAESRDPETTRHLERCRSYCHLLADDLRKNGLAPTEVDGEFVRLMWLASPLHDIGKTGVPDGVLLKPGRLTDEEFTTMKTHTSIGAEFVSECLKHCPDSRFLRITLDIVECHHERWDGGGYPHGLALEKIPLAARIMAVADVYDALTSKRVYKNALPHHVAVNIIVEGSGSHFDPMLVQAFCRQQDAFRKVRDAGVDSACPPEANTLRRAA